MFGIGNKSPSAPKRDEEEELYKEESLLDLKLDLDLEKLSDIGAMSSEDKQATSTESASDAASIQASSALGETTVSSNDDASAPSTISDDEGESEDGTTGKPLHIMDELTKSMPARPSVGDLVEGRVLGHAKTTVYIDLPPFGTGVIYGREYIAARDLIRKVSIGDEISAKVVEVENEEGYVELSLKEARQAAVWAAAEDSLKKKTPIEITIKDANKGGLIIEWQGISGFLPASQLSPDHYPRVADGNKDDILRELKKLIGEKLKLSIITADPKEGKLIFSEKTSTEKERLELVEKYSVGDVLEGKVTGAVDFGIFVKVESGLEGLVHISELDWALVENPKSLYNVGDSISVKVIEIKDGKLSLSVKALRPNPWLSATAKYEKDQAVKGVVIKFNRHGALVSIEEGVAGLVHVSEFGDEVALKKNLELGKTYDFKINLFEPKDQRMTLAFTGTKK